MTFRSIRKTFPSNERTNIPVLCSKTRMYMGIPIFETTIISEMSLSGPWTCNSGCTTGDLGWKSFLKFVFAMFVPEKL